MSDEKMYAEKELIAFGNYLLSNERNETIVHTVVKNEVNDVDVCNWKEKEKMSNP